MPAITDKDIILNFLRNISPDHKDRTYEDILNLTDIEMERCHDQIQWLFPLHEYSKHCDTYPILTPKTIEIAITDPIILYNLKLAKNRFENFLGIGEDSDVNKQRKWCQNHNHNLLRVTRAIRCLRLFGLNKEATDFYNKVIEVANNHRLSDITKYYWRKAYTEPMWESLQD